MVTILINNDGIEDGGDDMDYNDDDDDDVDNYSIQGKELEY